VLDCVTSIAKKEGIRAFYLSLNTTLMMNVPYGCVMVSANESAKKFLNPSGEFKFSSSMLAGTSILDSYFLLNPLLSA
jgi:solute carrier family 25 (mitochondrial iron transporter), member 28/37